MPTYPVPPGPKIPWHKIASAFRTDATRTGINSSLTLDEKTRANEPGNGNYVSMPNGSFPCVGILLPEPYDLDGWMACGSSISRIWTSTDTTTGLDGTWAQSAAANNATTNAISDFDPVEARELSLPDAIPGVRGVWFSLNATFRRFGGVLLYGRKSTLTGLVAWHPTLDQQFDHANADGGDQFGGDTRQVQFRVKNLDGAEKTNVTVSIEEKDPILGFDDMHTVDTGGGPGAFPANLGTLAPGAISSVVTIDQAIDDTSLGTAWADLVIDAD